MSRIPYDLSLIKGVVFDIDGVLSPVTVPLGDDGIPRRMTNLRDGYSIARASATGAIQLCIISGADAPGLLQRFSVLGIKNVYLGIADKLLCLQRWASKYGLKPEEIAYVGDDIPDLPCLRYVGLPVVPADGAAECRECASFVTKASGGYGVARELLVEILKVKGLWASFGDASKS